MRVQVFDYSPVAGEIAVWPKLKLTPAQDKQWGEFKALMLWTAPSFSDIWLAMMVDKYVEHAWFTDRIETAATDDKYLYVNPAFFFSLTIDEQVFVACHEVCHAMYGHSGLMYTLYKTGCVRYLDGLTLPFDADLFNRAMDYVINDQLVVGKMGVAPKMVCHWPGIISGDMGVLDAYRIVYKENKAGRGRGGMGGGGGGGVTQEGNMPGNPWGMPLRPGEGRGKSANKAMSERSQAEWDVAITAAMESARLQGRLPANLERAFLKRLQPKADWRDLYMLAVSRKIGNDRYTWGTLEPQFAYRRIGVPGRSTFGCDLVVIAVDTSGSINQRTLDVFLAETMALMEQAKPRRIIFVQCDAKVHEWDEIDGTDDLYGRKIKGGGGSKTEPVFNRIEEEGLTPDLLVYLTDLDVSFPETAPGYPVVWGSIKVNKYPFGEAVWVPKQAE